MRLCALSYFDDAAALGVGFTTVELFGGAYCQLRIRNDE